MEIVKVIKNFDDLHIIKQIILVGEDGGIRNIEINNEESQER